MTPLRQGATGPEVKALQKQLHAIGKTMATLASKPIRLCVHSKPSKACSRTALWAR